MTISALRENLLQLQKDGGSWALEKNSCNVDIIAVSSAGMRCCMDK
jgi:hypothetical protein